MSKFLTITFLAAFAEARFGQEQVPVSKVSDLSNFGNPGEAATLAGAVPGVLLAAANPCDKLTLADNIVTTLGTDPAVISGAAAVVAAEQNFNPFNVAIPSICDDATLPATAELRGIVPLVDPAVTGSNTENANSNASLATPFDATELSVADVMIAQGFSNFTKVDASGAKTAAADNSSSASNSTASTASTAAAADNSNANSGCSAGAASSSSSNTASNSTTASSNTNTNANTGSTSSSTTNSTTTSLAGADFGKCTPTMDFQLGRAQFNRKATEGTFFPTDSVLVASTGQSDALNPNIITNFICNQLTNVCEANQAAKDACASAKTVVEGLTTKDQTTADAFNQALGF